LQARRVKAMRPARPGPAPASRLLRIPLLHGEDSPRLDPRDNTFLPSGKENLDAVARRRLLAQAEMGLQRRAAAIAASRLDLPKARQLRRPVLRIDVHFRPDAVAARSLADRPDAQPVAVIRLVAI